MIHYCPHTVVVVVVVVPHLYLYSDGEMFRKVHAANGLRHRSRMESEVGRTEQSKRCSEVCGVDWHSGQRGEIVGSTRDCQVAR